MTGQELLDKLKTMSPEQLAEPIEVAVMTHTKAHPDYCEAFDFKPYLSRIYCSFGEGVRIVALKVAK